jgi:uncharacterized membrane protein YbhN (UPF0104 family)
VAIYHAPSVPRRTLVHAAMLLACAGLLAFQVRRVNLDGLFADVYTLWLVGAVAAFALSLAAAAHNISAFAQLRLRAVDTLRAQLAIGGLRVVAPSRCSAPSRWSARRSCPPPRRPPSRSSPLIVALAAVVAVPVARRAPRVRTVLVETAAAFKTIAGDLRDRPQRVVTGFGAAVALTTAHVAAFACCVHAVGGTGSPLALAVVYLGASSAGSLVPTPGGVGAVEIAPCSRGW